MNACLNAIKASLAILSVGFLGVLFSLTNPGIYLEEDLALAWLFKLRGQLTPPKDVVIVSIDKTSVETLMLPENPEDWPRFYYADLIKKINSYKPALIAINIVFKESRTPIDEQLLAQAIAEKKNVILVSYLKQNSIPQGGNSQLLSYETVIDSITSLTAAALSSAPFLIPKSASTVKQFWTYKDSAGDIPTFPVSVFECYVFNQAYPEIMDLMRQLKPAETNLLGGSFAELAKNNFLFERIRLLERLLLTEPSFAAQVAERLEQTHYPTQKKHLIKSWLASLNTNTSLYLNHYGGTEAITTISFYQALSGKNLSADTFKDKIVVIGHSPTLEPEKNQGFYNVFSEADGQTISQVELSATAIANLVDNIWLKPLPIFNQLLLLLVWASLLSLLCRLLRLKQAIIAVLTLTVCYLAFTYQQFVTANIWLPVFIPVLLQTPLILIAALFFRAVKIKQEQQHLKTTLGVLLPKEIIDRLPTHAGQKSIPTAGEIKQGVCLATDVDEYTKLTESLNMDTLSKLMNAYYATIFPPIENHNGYITDLAGDGMYAIWASQMPDQKIRSDACTAALAIKQELARFNQQHPFKLTTRIGLACGPITVGNTGAQGRYVYRAVGDSVNTASRIEGLNKLMGTQILVSATMMDGLSGFITRELGLFRLKGKRNPVRVFELLATTEKQNTVNLNLINRFQEALHLFESREWSAALVLFAKLNAEYPEDKPSQFFITYLNRHIENPPQPDIIEEPVIIEIS